MLVPNKSHASKAHALRLLLADLKWTSEAPTPHCLPLNDEQSGS
jgi:hypothetical protein